MKAFFSSLVALGLAGIPSALAADWHFVTYYPASGEQFIGFTGQLHVPKLPQAGTYYLWPGLQPTDGSGVYQNVLDGRTGSWWFGSGWCCANPSLPWGGGESAAAGDIVTFSNVRGASSWTSTVGKVGGTANAATNTFSLNSKNFNQALFAIELTGVPWDFGPLTFTNIVITSTGTDKSWCNSSPSNYNNAAVLSISGVSAVVSGNSVQCNIASLTLSPPS